MATTKRFTAPPTSPRGRCPRGGLERGRNRLLLRSRQLPRQPPARPRAKCAGTASRVRALRRSIGAARRTLMASAHAAATIASTRARARRSRAPARRTSARRRLHDASSVRQSGAGGSDPPGRFGRSRRRAARSVAVAAAAPKTRARRREALDAQAQRVGGRRCHRKPRPRSSAIAAQRKNHVSRVTRNDDDAEGRRQQRVPAALQRRGVAREPRPACRRRAPAGAHPNMDTARAWV